MILSVSHNFLPKQNSVAASQVMDHFGIGFEQGRHVIAEQLELPIEPSQVVLFTGASGSGKSSLMRAAVSELEATAGAVGEQRCRGAEEQRGQCGQETRGRGDKETRREAAPCPPVPWSPCPPRSSAPPPLCSSADPTHSHTTLSLNDLPLPQTLLIDSLNLPAAEAMNLLSTCGLGEAQLMLRTPAELSDGQRYRFRLALALSQRPQWVVADEFTATLDRTLAKVVAYNIRRLADRTGVGFLLATTHEDVAADLQPDVHVRCRLDGEVRVEMRSASLSKASSPVEEGKGRTGEAGSQAASDVAGHLFTSAPLPLFHASSTTPASKKKLPAPPSPSPPTSGSPLRPVATGRTSLGGITAATTSGLSDR